MKYLKMSKRTNIEIAYGGSTCSKKPWNERSRRTVLKRRGRSARSMRRRRRAKRGS